MIAQSGKLSRAMLGALVMALVMALMLVPLAAAPASAATVGFRDVTGSHQFYREISWMVSKRITTGYSDQTFRPESNVSREAFAAFLYRLEGRPSVTLPKKSPFKDVKTSDQFYKEIVWLSKSGITTGWSDGTFRPKWNIARDAMAAFLYRYDGRPKFTPPSKSPFKDLPKSSQFYKEVTWLAKSGITTGYADGSFKPWDGASRAATAAFLFRGYGSSSYQAPKYVAPKVTWRPSEVISVAKSQVGYREPSFRHNKYNTWIGGNSAWCSVYVSWVFAKAGFSGYVPKSKYFDTSYTSGAASTTYVGKLKAAGVLDWNVSLGDLQRGDVVLMNWHAGQGVSHSAIVDRVEGNGAWFYEGNTSDGTGTNSDRGVFHRWRNMKYIDAVYDPRDYYDATH